ncbi:hypothetical protein ACSHT0_06710 [Tepidicaulis sp. LMO-SS28]|uniref:hypothetical protein n=1 Tax=Tepidicaulis sp. LMO-SS28 TaxID=3447455 RepID=UPI003EE27D79
MSDNTADKDKKEMDEEEGAAEGLKLTTRQMVQLAIVIAMGLVLLLGFVFVVAVMAIRAGDSGEEKSSEVTPDVTVPQEDAAEAVPALPPLEGRVYVRAGERLLSLGGDEDQLVLYLMTDGGEEIRVVDPETGDIVRRIEVIRGQR